MDNNINSDKTKEPEVENNKDLKTENNEQAKPEVKIEAKVDDKASDKPGRQEEAKPDDKKASEEKEVKKPVKEASGEKEEKPKAEKPAAKKEEVKKKPPPKKKPKSAVVVPAEQYLVTSSPHIFSKDSVSKIMWTVNICLLFAIIPAVIFFGPRVLMVIISSLIGAMGSEFLWQHINKQPIKLKDGSAFMTGLLLAYNLPPAVPWWIPFLGSAFAIIIAKQLFGGLGNNIFNPALIGRAFLLASWPVLMTTWNKPTEMFTSGVTGATPLNMMKQNKFAEFLVDMGSRGNMYMNLFIGKQGGCIGETCALVLILGGLFLIYKKYIDWQIPATYIGTVAILAPVFYNLPFSGIKNPLNFVDTVYFSIFSGGLILGAIYMATDYVTTPSTLKGRIIFAVGCGILTSVIRVFGGYPEGVCYSILIMNAFAPLIDAKTKSNVFGVTKTKEKQPA